MRLSFRKYVEQLVMDPTGSLEQIANATGTSIAVVTKNVQYMIKKKFFSNAYIDTNANRLVILALTNNQSDQGESSATKNIIMCKCPNCGGPNRIPIGDTKQCDYCGTLIHA